MEEVLFELDKISAGRASGGGKRVVAHSHEQKYRGTKTPDTFHEAYLDRPSKGDMRRSATSYQPPDPDLGQVLEHFSASVFPYLENESNLRHRVAGRSKQDNDMK